MIWKKLLPLLPALLLAGCATSTFTRVTPLEQPRNSNNLYPVEVIYNSDQQSLRHETLKPYVLANGELYPLRPVPMVPNRWEGYVPVSPTADGTVYRFKFEYMYNTFGSTPASGNDVSPQYHLKITQ